MKKCKILIVVLLTALLSQHALAQEEVDEIIDADKNSIVEIEHLGGEATIIGWDKNQVEVKGTLGKRTEEFIFERSGKTIKIEVKVKKNRKGYNNWNSSEDGDELFIMVPENSRVKYNSTNAEVTINKIFGGTDVDVINGDIEASDLANKIQLETVNGDIEAFQLEGEVRVKTVNGDAEGEQKTGDLFVAITVNGDIDFVTSATDAKVDTVNGDMELKFAMVEELVMSTVNGRIEADLSLVDGGVVKSSSVGGDITLKFNADIQAAFDIEAHAGGSIRNRLTDDKVQKAKYGPARWLEFNKGEPNSSVKASTVNGSITIAQQ